ncbi:hypothetical protein AVEN_107816-1 [Araneus ventricosus]|uniref:Uncharacterized protein n=1 Tax=Araneus ventricosus TaxID=182803 RepID=A0A4Y2IJJ6_ARAVE|nr:hypothetical protein AVEN_107816-1 [Araneus ventricosus]
MKIHKEPRWAEDRDSTPGLERHGFGPNFTNISSIYMDLGRIKSVNAKHSPINKAQALLMECRPRRLPRHLIVRSSSDYHMRSASK